ncbi:MAG: FecR domain-containing protein [Saprospiraceae bacterium]|nr:FecR domain-containing protein [Saprospiraceae bacterium]
MNDHYNTYSVDQLIGDEQFVDWVLNPTPEIEQRWQLWLNQHPENRQKVSEAKSILKNLTFKKMDTRGMAPRIWERIEHDLQPAEPASESRPKIFRWIALTAAAAAVLVLLILNWGNSELTSIEVSPGMANLYQLPDNSEIHINDGSKISYDPASFNEVRDIFLQGEAFFEVTKGSPFTVHTGNGDVQVLGTSFNIFSHGRDLEVICKTGKVQVTREASSVILTPGEKAMLNSENQLVKNNSEPEIAWLTGTFKYEEATLSQVAAELQRQFGIQIHLPESAEAIRYTGFFLDNDLDQALNSVFWPLKLKYDRKDNEIFVSREN